MKALSLRTALLLWIAIAEAAFLNADAQAADVVGIDWDESTLTFVAQAGYARIIRTAEGDLLCVADSGGAVWTKRSEDDGRTWISPIEVAGCDYGAATNPELLLLESGSILCCYNERPTDGEHAFAIMTMISADHGRTWGDPERVFEADTEWDNGCWEPAAIQLPSGELQLFFANESPYRSSGEQQITMLRAKGEGKKWQKPKKISFRTGQRDGMPVPLVLAGKGGIVVAIEDSGFNGRFKPVIVHSNLRSSWSRGFVDAASNNRWGALAEPLDAETNAAAPYIRQMAGGETILSVQVTYEGGQQPRMVVYVGDSSARNFGHPSEPFNVPPEVGCYWNSLFVKDTETVTALSGTALGGRQGIWTIDGTLIRAGSDVEPSMAIPGARVPPQGARGKVPNEPSTLGPRRGPGAGDDSVLTMQVASIEEVLPEKVVARLAQLREELESTTDQDQRARLAALLERITVGARETADWRVTGVAKELRADAQGESYGQLSLRLSPRVHERKGVSALTVGDYLVAWNAEHESADQWTTAGRVERLTEQPAWWSTYRNPIIRMIGPADPAVVLFEGLYYLYPTLGSGSYEVFVSDDLVHWQRRGTCFSDARGGVWAPDVFHHALGDGKFYLYYTVNGQIGVSVADHPMGPFEGRRTLVRGAIDAHMFQDDDGRLYLYYAHNATGFRIDVQAMKDPVTPFGKAHTLIRPEERWEQISGHVAEGPWMLKRDGTYYLMYSGTGANSPDYAVGYATSRSPLGPFTKHPGNPIAQRGDGVLGPGHNSVVTGPDGQFWMVYHQKKGTATRWDRFLAIDPLWFDSQGVLHASVSRETERPSPRSGGHPTAASSPLYIDWDERTLTLVVAGGDEGLIIRSGEGALLCAYRAGDDLHIKRSADDGRTWGEPVDVAGFEHGTAAAPALLLLADGTLLCAYNERPEPSNGAHPYSIAVATSGDDGRTWSPGVRVYAAELPQPCSDPSIVQLPAGEVQLFFATEGPYPTSDERQIMMLRSQTNGESWSEPRTISFRYGHRDGSPLPLVLADRRGIAVVVEDSGLEGGPGPAVVHTSIRGNWPGRPINGPSRQRWGALADPLPRGSRPGAACIGQLSTGETLLSLLVQEVGRPNTIVRVYVGDESAQGFTTPSTPFNLGFGVDCRSSALFVKGPSTVTVIAATTIDGVYGEWAIDGRLRRSQPWPLRKGPPPRRSKRSR